MKTIIIGLFLFFCFLVPTLAQNPVVLDSLKAKLTTAAAKDKFGILCSLCFEMKYQDAEAARTYCEEALKLAQELGDIKGEGLALQYLGTTHEGQGNYELALDFQKQALVLFKQITDSLEIANTLNNIGIILDQKGDDQNSLENYFAALQLYESLNHPQGIARASNNIGVVYKKQQNYDKVLEFYKKALHIYEDLNHSFGIAATKVNIGSIYLDKKNYPATIDYSEQALVGFDSLNIEQFKPYALENMGLAYGHLGALDKALDHHQRALGFYRSYGNKKETAFTLNSIANIYLRQQKLTLAKKVAEESLQIAKAIGANEELQNANLSLSKYYESQNDFAQAFFYFKNYTAVKDTLFKIEKTESIEELKTQYLTEKKEKENIQLRSENEIQELTISKKQNQVWALAIGALLLVLIGALLFNQNRFRQKQILAQQALDFQEKAIQLTFETQEKERKRIARDLHDGIGQQLVGLKMTWQKLLSKLATEENQAQTQLLQVSQILDDTTTEVRNISHQMMPKTLQENGLVKALEDTFQKSFNSNNIQYDFTHHKINNRFPENIEVGLFRIAQELVNNIIKHAQAKEVSFQLIKSNQNLVLIVEDDGRGFKEDQITQGHGLLNIQFRVQSMKGKINMESNPGAGTLVTVRIPIA